MRALLKQNQSLVVIRPADIFFFRDLRQERKKTDKEEEDKMADTMQDDQEIKTAIIKLDLLKLENNPI